MKIFTTILIACFTVIFIPEIKSQITITQSDMPQVGTTVIVDSDLTPSVTPGSSGPSQTWNFTALNTTKSSTNNFVAAGSTPYASQFPGANLADSVWGFPGYNYLSSQSGSFSIIGGMPIIGGYQVTVHFTPPYEQIALPANYNGTSGGNTRGIIKAIYFHYVAYDSAKGTLTITYADTIDAWGIVHISSGMFNALRQKRHQVEIDSVFLYSGITHTWGFYQAQTTIANSYVWYASGIHYPLVQMQMDSSSATVKSVAWYPAPSGINEEVDNTKTLVFPNPCSTQVTFHHGKELEGCVYLFDITGRQLAQVTVKNGTATVNTSSFPNGIYIYKIANKEGTLVDKGKLTVE